MHPGSTSSSSRQSPPQSPPGPKRPNDRETPGIPAKRQRTEGTDGVPPELNTGPVHGGSVAVQSLAAAPSTEAPPTHGTLDLDSLWRALPLTVVQQIAWVLAPPTHLSEANANSTRQCQAARAIGQSLLRLAMANRQTLRYLQPLLRMARWSVELALLGHGRTTQAPIDFLLSNPMAALKGEPQSVGLEYLPPEYLNGSPERRHGRRLDALLQNAIEHTQVFDEPQVARTEMAEALLTRLFDAWCARLQQEVNASVCLPHLPLHDLPLRLFRSVAGNGHVALDPPFLFEALKAEDVCTQSPSSMPAKLLLQHLKGFDDDLKLFVWFHLYLLFKGDGETSMYPVEMAMREHGLVDEPVIHKVRVWRKYFLNAADEDIPLALAEEVLAGLKRMPLMGAAVPLALLLKFCTGKRMRALANDARLTELISRAMVEMAAMIPAVTEYRLEYLLRFVPQELGLAAFQRLTEEQRAVVLQRGARAGNRLAPYIQAELSHAEPVPPQ